MERQTKHIYTSTCSTQDHQIKRRKAVNWSVRIHKFLSDKFKEYEEDRPKKDKIIKDLKSEVGSLSTKIEKIDNLKDQQE